MTRAEPPHGREDLDTVLERFAAAVETSPHNLVSRRALAELRTRHVPESRALAEQLPAGPADLLDVGSGGGFPGMVIAAVRPDLRVTLLDATRKKTEFLRATAADLGLAVEVLTGRAEELVRDHGRRYDLVTARAVAPLDRLVGWTLPFLRPGGRLYAVKGERWAEELAAARRALTRSGGEVVGTPSPDAVDGTPGTAPRVVIIAAAR